MKQTLSPQAFWRAIPTRQGLRQRLRRHHLARIPRHEVQGQRHPDLRRIYPRSHIPARQGCGLCTVSRRDQQWESSAAGGPWIAKVQLAKGLRLPSAPQRLRLPLAAWHRAIARAAWDGARHVGTSCPRALHAVRAGVTSVGMDHPATWKPRRSFSSHQCQRPIADSAANWTSQRRRTPRRDPRRCSAMPERMALHGSRGTTFESSASWLRAPSAQITGSNRELTAYDQALQRGSSRMPRLTQISPGSLVNLTKRIED